MSAIFYTAKRSLYSDHLAGEAFSFDIGMQVIDRRSRAFRKTKKAYGGLAGHWLHRIETIFSFKTVPVLANSNNHLSMREFLDSCLGGESFNLDPYGTIAVPVQEFAFQLESEEWSEDRIGTTDYFSFSFTARVI